MKNKVISAFFMVGFGLSINAVALPSLTDAFKVIRSAASSGLSDAKQKLCRKANVFSGTFSLRSFEGQLCNTKIIAAIAMGLCSKDNIDNFNSSQCATNAQKALNQQPMTQADKDAVKKVIGNDSEGDDVLNALKDLD